MRATEPPERESTELLATAGMALARRAWEDARELYERALALEESAEALEGFAAASWWQNDIGAAIEDPAPPFRSGRPRRRGGVSLLESPAAAFR